MRGVHRSVVATVGIVGMVIILAGCSPAASTARAIQTSTPSPSPSATSTATATAPISAMAAAGCFGSGYAAHTTLTQVGDFLMTPVRLSGRADYFQSVALPDGTPLTKPYQLQFDNSTGLASSTFSNPDLAEDTGGFTWALCNTSATKTYTVTAVLATIAAFTPYSGQLSQWNPCQGRMNSHHQLYSADCVSGGLRFPRFHAIFQGSPTAGASVEMRQTGFDLSVPGDGLGRLPLALAPRTVIRLYLGMDTPTQVGSYAFTFGVRLQTGETLTSANSPAMLLAPVAHSWDGNSCNQSAFLSQITPTNPETYYVCPAA